jgi:hypothetical protein
MSVIRVFKQPQTLRLVMMLFGNQGSVNSRVVLAAQARLHLRKTAPRGGRVSASE